MNMRKVDRRDVILNDNQSGRPGTVNVQFAKECGAGPQQVLNTKEYCFAHAFRSRESSEGN